MGSSRVQGLVLVNPWPRLLPGMSPLAPLAMVPSVGHMGSRPVQYAYVRFAQSCAIYSRNEPALLPEWPSGRTECPLRPDLSRDVCGRVPVGQGGADYCVAYGLTSALHAYGDAAAAASVASSAWSALATGDAFAMPLTISGRSGMRSEAAAAAGARSRSHTMDPMTHCARIS